MSENTYELLDGQETALTKMEGDARVRNSECSLDLSSYFSCETELLRGASS